MSQCTFKDLLKNNNNAIIKVDINRINSIPKIRFAKKG